MKPARSADSLHKMTFPLCVYLLTSALILHSVIGYYIQPNLITFSSHPQSQVAVTNSTVTFRCSIDKTKLDTNLPALDIVWYHNGSTALSCTSITVIDEGSVIVSVCTIESVNVNHTGWYNCQLIDGNNNTLCHNSPCIKTATMSSSAHLILIGHLVSNTTHYISANHASSTVLQCHKVHDITILGNYSFNDFDVIWKKDNQLIRRSTEIITILSSGNLLITSNTSTSDQIFGIYQCLVHLHDDDSNEILINQINLLQNENSFERITLIPSLSASYNHSIHIIQSTMLELVCHYSGVSDITWTYNGNILHNVTGKSLLSSSSLQSGNYCCSMNSISSCTYVHVLNVEMLSSTIFISPNTSHQLNCGNTTTLAVNWFHNGIPVSLNSSTNMISNYGVYQCVIPNSSLEPLALYRVLPYGLANPVSAVLPIRHALPAINFSLTWKLPELTGGLDEMTLLVKVVTISRKFFYNHTSTQTLGLYEPWPSYTLYRDYWFEITIVNENGDNVSETIKTSKLDLCSALFYSPLPPFITLSCGNQSSQLHWTRSNLEPFPSVVQILVNFRCFNESSAEVFSENVEADVWMQNGNISTNKFIGSEGYCNYTAYGSRSTCIGLTATGACNVIPITPTTTISMATFPISDDVSDSIPLTVSTFNLSTTSSVHQNMINKSSIDPLITQTPTTDTLITQTPTTTHSIDRNSSTIALLTDSPIDDNSATVIGLAAAFILMFVMFAIIIIFIVSIVLVRRRRLSKKILFIPAGIDSEPKHNGDDWQVVDIYVDSDAISVITQYEEPKYNLVIQDDNVSYHNVKVVSFETNNDDKIRPSFDDLSPVSDTSGTSSSTDYLDYSSYCNNKMLNIVEEENPMVSRETDINCTRTANDVADHNSCHLYVNVQ